MATAADLIKSALVKIGAIAAGETPSSAEMTDALDALNDILEEWSNDGYMISEVVTEEFDFAASVGAYLIGTGATWNTVRPQLILNAWVKAGAIQRPIEVVAHDQWSKRYPQDLRSDFPAQVFYNPKFPAGELNFWPKPASAHKAVIESLKPLTAIANAATALAYPPGYKKALKYALAYELQSDYGRPEDPKIEAIAARSKAAIQRTNTDQLLMVPDAFGMNEGCFE